jgi:PKD repeat protein
MVDSDLLFITSPSARGISLLQGARGLSMAGKGCSIYSGRESALVFAMILMISAVMLPLIAGAEDVTGTCTGSTNLVVNGGFEDAGPRYSYQCPCPLDSPWEYDLNNLWGVSVQAGYASEDAYAAVVSLDSSDTGDWVYISQQVTGGQYCTLSFIYHSWISDGRASDYYVYLGGQEIWHGYDTGDYYNHKTVTLDVSGFSGTNELKFYQQAAIGGPGHGDWFIDAVKLMAEPTPPSPPPPPPASTPTEVTFKMKINSIASNYASHPVSLGDPSGGEKWVWIFYLFGKDSDHTPGTMQVLGTKEVGSPTQQVLSDTSGILELGKEYKVSWKYSDANQGQLYIDDVAVGSPVSGGALNTELSSTVHLKDLMYVGGGRQHTDFDGYVWDVMVDGVLYPGTPPPTVPPEPTPENLLDPCPGPGTRWTVSAEGYPMYWDFRSTSSPVGDASCTMIYHAGNYDPQGTLYSHSFTYLKSPPIQLEPGHHYKLSFWYRGKSLNGPHGQEGNTDMISVGSQIFTDSSLDPAQWRYYEKVFTSDKVWFRTYWVPYGWNEYITDPMWFEVTSIRLVETDGPNPPPTPIPEPPQLIATNIVVNSGYDGWPTFGREYTVTLELENPQGVQTTRVIEARETPIEPVLFDDKAWILEPVYTLDFDTGQTAGRANFYYLHTGDPFHYLKTDSEYAEVIRFTGYAYDGFKLKFEYGVDRAIKDLEAKGKSLGALDILRDGFIVLDLVEVATELQSLLTHLKCTPTVYYLYQFTAENVYARLPLQIDPTTGAAEIFEGPLNEYPGFFVTLQAQIWKFYAFWNAVTNEIIATVYDVIGYLSGNPEISLITGIGSICHSYIADESYKRAIDPVPDYTAPIEVKTLHIAEMDSLPESAGKEYLRQLEITYSDMTGLTDATIKYNGAVEAQDPVWAEKLLKEEYRYQSMVSNDYYALKMKAVPFTEELRMGGINPTEDDIQVAKNDIAQDGLHEEQIALFMKYGYTDSDLDGIKDLILAIPDRYFVHYGSMILVSLQMSENLNTASLASIGAELGDEAPPYADFTTSTNSGVSPLVVQFTDTSLRGPARWSWAFGEGAASDEPSPAHTYAVPGTYTVALTVSNDDGSDTRTRDSLINVLIPGKMKVLPRTLNLASKGAFVAFVRLPDGYNTGGVIKDSVLCNGAPAVKIIRSNRFPRVFGAIFRRGDLQEVPVGDQVAFTMTGKLSQTGEIYEFTASDTIRTMRRNTRIPDEIEDASKLAEEKLFEMYTKQNP